MTASPSIPIAPGAASFEPHVARWVPQSARCGAGAVDISGVKWAIPVYVRRDPGDSADAKLTFKLDQTGRAYEIALVRGETATARPFDLIPSLAASEFAPQTGPSDCEIVYRETITPVADISDRDAIELWIDNRARRLPRSVWDRLSPGDCRAGRVPKPLVRHFPDFRKFLGPIGARDRVSVSYDLDGSGKPINLRVVETSGDDAFEREVLGAISRSEYDESDRTGCLRIYYTGVGIVPTSPRPDLDSHGERPEACDAEDKWAKPPTLTYPSAYRRRAVQGWVTLRYDVAPWGSVGNIEVLDAYPTRALEPAALRVLRSAKYKSLETGLTGCVDRVVFKMNNRDAQPGSTE